MSKKEQEFFVIRSETTLYAVCDSVGEAEGFRANFHMSCFDVWGPVMAKSREQAARRAATNMGLRFSPRMQRIFKAK